MTKHDVNININDGRISGKAGQSNANDSDEIRNLTKLLRSTLNDSSNKTSNAIEKAVSKAIREMVKSQPSGSTFKESDLKNIMRGVGKELGNEVIKSITNSLPKNPGTKQDSTSIERSINNSMTKAADKMATVLASRLSSQTGLTINTSELSKGIAGAMRSSMPSGTEKATRELVQAVGSLKNITRDIGNLTRQIGSMRQSGGKVDVGEIGSVLSALKKIAEDFKVLSQESTRAKDSLRGVAVESKQLITNLGNAIDKVKTSVEDKVSGVQQRAVGDPKAFTREVVNTLTNAIKSSESLKGTSLEKAVRNLEGKLGDMSKLAGELQKFQASFKKDVASGSIKIEGVDKVIKEFDQVVTKLGNVPKTVGMENPPKEWEQLTKALNGFTQNAAKLTTQVKLIVDDSDIKKLIPAQVTMKIKPEVDKKSIEDDVSDALDKAGDKKAIKPKVDKKAIKDGVGEALDESTSERAIKPKVDKKGIVDGVAEALDEAASKKPIKPEVDASSLKALKAEINDVIDDVRREADKNNIKVKVEPVVKKLELALEKNDLEGMRKSLSELSNFKIDTIYLTNELRKSVSILEGQQVKIKVSPTLDDKDFNRKAKQLPVVDRKTKQIDEKKARQLADNHRKLQDTLAYPTYNPGVIKPSDRALGGQAVSSGAVNVRQATEQNISALSTSLNKLQEQVVGELEKQFSEAKNKWAVVKPAGGTARDAFKLTPGERQWTMQIANLDRLQKILQNFDSNVVDLVSSYKTKFVQERVALSGGPQKQADLVGQWLKTVSNEQIKAVGGLDDLVKKELSNIKTSFSGTEVSDEMRIQIRKAFGDIKLEDVFKKTYAEAEAKRELHREGLVKQVAIPAAKITKTGDVSFQTVHGAERSLPKFAKFETGFENLYKKLTSLAAGADEESKKQIFSEARGYAESIKKLGVRPGPENLDDAEKLATKMLASVVKGMADPKAARQYIKDLYSEASKSKGFAVQEMGGGPADDFKKSIDDAIKSFESLDKGAQTFNNFVATMKKANLTAYDVVRNLNSLEVTNVYDVMGQVLSGNKKVSPLRSLGSKPHEERPIRDFDKAISEVEGLMPLHEQNRPRRGFHQENVVNLLSRTAPFYSDGKEDKLDTDAQKKLIKDLNLEISETLKRMGQVHGPEALPGNLKRVTSLGIPESQAGNVEEYRPYGTSNTKFLKTLNATGLKMYGEDLTTMAPFQQFQQAGRNISNITNAMVDLSGRAELPKLRSVRERDLIESGRYGDRGYGYNVTSELRNTAANFEDQIVIAGKLAKALTSAVSTLVKPGPSGRVGGSTSEDRITGSGVTEIKEIKIDNQDIDKVAREYMKILGVPEEYKGRADKALIEDVKKTVAVVRGESVEVQQAKLAETFMNYFGRKLTTRYGSKGVSVTPTGDTENLSKIISEHAGAKIKLEPSQTLGAAFIPKSMGKLASEIFGDKASKELKEQLIASGNKFIIDLFQKTGEGAIVVEDEAKKNAQLYKDFSQKWKEIVGGDVPGLGVAGISKIKETYKGLPGDRSLTEVKPIDVRISSYGAAKRGLQTEFLESIFSNVAGTGDAGVTTMRRLDQTAYDDLLKRGGLAKYSAALGFKGVDKPEDQIASELYSKFTGKSPDKFAEALAGGDEKAIIAKRAAALEAASSFYSKIVDEFGNVRTGLVGEKFLQIIEEPTENPAWTRGQVAGGEKGARLNLPAFSAYASTFGEQSNFIKEIQGSLDVNAKKHWEYMKALQAIQDKDSTLYNNLTKDLKTVDIGEVKKFDLATGVYGKEYIVDEAGNKTINPRSLSGTVMDTDKFVSAFKLAVPTGKYGPSGEIKKEEFYVPGAAARGTYPDPLLAGERGLEEITRRLSHFVNMAKELQEVMQAPDKFLEPGEVKKKIPPIIGNWVKDAWKLAESKAPDAEAQLEGILNRMLPALSTTGAPSPSLINTAGRTEFQYVQDFYRSQMNKVNQGSKTRPEALATTISTISDLIVGKSEGTPEQLAAPTGLTRAIDQGVGGVFAQKLGIDVVQDTINKRVAAMNKAKIDYYNSLAEAATGKTGSINELLFSRKIPAVIGKATTAVVDKRDDIKKFGNSLSKIEAKYGVDLGVSAESLAEISEKHSKAIDNYKKIGIPVLKETELGIPETFAKKIPLDFTKKFKNTGDPAIGIIPQKDEDVSGTLFDLLKYTESLKKGASKESPDRQKEIFEYIENELVPYIESIRFPFTGTSSLAPFKPKLLDKKSYVSPDGRTLSENALMVPGVPEGMDELGSIIAKLQKVLDNESTNREDMGLMQKREELQKAGGPQSEIDKLTDQIRDLSAAIAEIIPKYTSQAQKLDFDGDQIEIHSAKTAAARRDIEAHYKRFHTRDTTKDPYTADVFRTQFLSDAAVASTGQYVLGESAAAFEKKFPAGGGFDFLKSPFLTEDLEYLSASDALKALKATNPNIGNIENVIKDALVTQNKPMDQISAVMDTISKVDTTDTSSAAQNIMDAISSQHKDLLVAVEKGIKKRLYEEKLSNSIEAQLFKIHTGPDVESLYRVHRLGETATGFSGGEIAGRTGKSTSYFQSRFPADMKSYGGRPEEEFQTMLNEMVRFGIQKGMDVKHAGEKPVARDMIEYLTRGTKGASELWSRIQDSEDNTFGDLRDFSKANESSIKMRLGALSTSDIMAEARKLVESRGEKLDVSGMNRDELIKLIVEKVGFKGFLEELSSLIKKEAIEGLISQAETWSPEKKAKPGGGLPAVSGDLKNWATLAVQQQMERGGIDIRQDITNAQAPLYSMRTSFASPASEYKKYMEKFGAINVPDQSVEGMSEEDAKKYKFKYRASIATAENIKQELRAFSGSKQGGAYADMIRGAEEALYTQQGKIADYVTELKKEGYNPDTIKKEDLFNRVMSRKGVSSLANNVLNMEKGMSEEVSRLSDMVGIPGLDKAEAFSIKREEMGKFAKLQESVLRDNLFVDRKKEALMKKTKPQLVEEADKFIDKKDPLAPETATMNKQQLVDFISAEDFKKRVEDYANQMVEKAQALAQLDRVVDVLLSNQSEGKVLRDLMPKPEQVDQYSSYDKKRSEIFNRAREKMKFEGPQATMAQADFMAFGGSRVPNQAGAGIGTGGVVPVHLVGVDPSVVLNVNGLEGLGLVRKESTSVDLTGEMDKNLQKFNEEMKELGAILKKVKPPAGKSSSFESFYTPSKLSGGGDIFASSDFPFNEESRFEGQVERIARNMVHNMDDVPDAADSVLTSWGTLIHDKLEKVLNTRGNVKTEQYKEIEDTVGGWIGGTADILEYDTPDKQKIKAVADIKTVNTDKLEKIKAAIKEAGSSEFSKVADKLDNQTRRQLEDNFSQLNAYLKIFDEAAQAELRFYDREGMGNDVDDYTSVKFNFDPDRFRKDMEAIAAARQKVKQSGREFAGSQTRDIAKSGIKPEGASQEEIDRGLELVKKAYERTSGTRNVVKDAIHSLGASRGEKYESRQNIEAAAKKFAQREQFSNFSEDEFEKYLKIQKPVEGENAEAFLANLKILHDQSKLYQKSKGLDMGVADKLPKQVKTAIESVKESGPDYQAFIDLTGKLKDLNRPDFNGLDMIKAWKLYRMAIGDWMLNRADQAYKEMMAFQESGDEREAHQAYGDFTKRVADAQEFVRNSIGKTTDIYTDDKRFVYPNMAQAAGVYMSPKQIMKKIGEPLGDDPQLIERFKKTIEGIHKEVGKVPPVEAARSIFEDLSDVNNEMASNLSNAERFKRLGPEILDAWDFDKLTERVTRLRAALQQVLKDNKEMNAEQRKNLENIVKYLKNVENMYSSVGSTSSQTGYGQTGIVPVPKFETPENQKALHARNIQAVREYFRRPAEEGGPEIGERFSYQEKIVGSAGETIKSVIHNFKKYGEELLSSGQKTGQFSESQQDLIEKMQRVNASFSNAVRRVVMWGAASRLVYGGVANLKSSLNELAEIEVGFAQLRMVMSPLESDFDGLSKAATGFAKQYGVPVTGVLKSMKIFAQQGLKQSEIVDRTQTATLASNVTTLDAKEATEALTSAMKIFREEGTQSMRFLDAWSEVEAKHAITAGDMANAIKKSAAAAKSAGVTFNQLNGMVAAVGAVTRQTGKEVGTSFRFIFRRLFAEEGPKNLAKMGIPTLTPEGELRGAFDILGDLAGKWKDLTTAQRMNMAQAIGGTRQYNSLLVLMDQWDEVLRGIRNSTNSKGSAERRNAEIMKTYAKQLERTKAAATEFKMEIGKIALPAFTAGTKAITLMFETLTAIPAPIKAATAALAAFFTLGAKGIDIFDMIGGSISKGSAIFGELGSEFSKQMKIAKYEITGKADATTDVFGLKTLTPSATKAANKLKEADGSLTEQGSKISDFHSSIGKMMFQFMSWGKSYNEMIGSMLAGTGVLTEKVGEGAQDVGAFFSSVVDLGEGGIGGAGGVGAVYGGLKKLAKAKGLGGEAVKDTLQTQGLLKGGGKLLGKATLYAGEIGGAATYITGQAIDTIGEQMGKGGHKILKDWTTQNAGFVKSVAPLALTIAGMIPAFKAGAEYFSKMTGSAQDFEQSMNGVIRKNESQLKSIRDMIQEYDTLSDKVKEAAKAEEPATKARRQELGTYESPLTTKQNIQARVIELTNQLAVSNQNLVVGYDELGNAVLKTGTNFKSYLKDLENLEVQTGVAASLEILKKYLDDLASGNETEKIKLAFKELADAFPVLGELLSRNIKVSPAKQLEVATEDLNKRLNLKQKYPMSAAADADIKRLQEVLGKARDAYTETFSDMKRVYGTVLSRANLRGLTKEQIEDVVRSPELRQAYEMQIKIDPRFKLVEGVTWQDIMGKELLSALNPAAAGGLDVTSEFTKANLESAGIASREGKATSGDVVTFYKDLASAYNIAGNQAIVKMKDTDEWVVEYFNTRTLKLEERPLDEVEGIVENIFPLQKIKESLSYRMDSLNTFVAGASAGLVGLSEKDFKRDFNLGERFFGEISTNTLLQGNKGFMPSTGYGEVEGMKNFKNDLKEFYFRPMEELRSKTEQFEKLKLEGLETGDITISQSFYEEINKLLDVLKNNQVVIQFRAVFVDLMKEMATGQRVLKEEIAIMRRRSDMDVVPGGLTRGMPNNLESLNFGTRDIKSITARQRLLTNDQDFRKQATNLRELELVSQNNLGMLDKFERALVQIDDIAAEARGFGASLSPSQLQNYIEKVVPEGDDGPFYELTKVNKGIEQNTSDTADKLDKMLENMGDQEAVEKNLKSIVDRIGTGSFREANKTVNALERVAGIRDRAESRGDQDAVVAANEALGILSKKLVSQVGYKKGLDLVDNKRTLFSKNFKPEEFQQRVLSGVDPKVFVERLKKSGPAKGGFLGIGSRPDIVDSDVFKEFEKAQQEQVHQTTFSSKNLARVAAVTGALATIQRSGNKKIIDKIDEQIGTLDQTIADKRKAGVAGEELAGLVKDREALSLKRADKRKEADFYGTVAAISATGFAVTELAKAFGLTEKQVTALGISAVGTYSAMVLASKITGEDLPESAKKFGEKLEETVKKTTAGEHPGVFEAREFRKAGEAMTKDFEDQNKKVFGKDAASIAKEATKSKVDAEKLVNEIDDSLKARAKNMAEYKGLGTNYIKYADMKEEQARERAKLSEKGKSIDSSEYKDLIKQQEAEKAEFLRSLNRKEKRGIIDKYPTQQDELSKYVGEALGKELEKTGDHLVRGLEKSEAPSKLKQAIVAYLAVGLSDYASNKTADKTVMAETEKIMKRQSEALADLVKHYPDAAEAALMELQKEAGALAKPENSVATTDKPLVQDTEKAKEEIKKQIAELRDTYIEEQKKAIEEQRKAQNQLADRESRETFKMQQEEAIRARRTSSDAFNISRRYSLTNILNKQLQGFPGELELPLTDEQMTTQQRVYKEADKSLKGVIDAYAGGIQQLESMKGNLERLKQASREQEDIASTTDDDDIRRRAKERHKDLNNTMEDQIKVIDSLSEKLRKLGETKALFDQFSSSLHRMKDALKEVGVQEAVERIPGMQTYKDSMDKLLGGGHPDAVVPISTEQSYMASKVGVDLQHMRSTQYEVRAAELLSQINSSRDPIELANLRRQYINLSEQRSRDLQVYKQRQQDDRMRRAYQPYEQQVVDLERVRTSQFINDKQAIKIEDMQRKLVDMLNQAPERISTEKAMEELEKNKGKISKKDYNSEKRRIEKLEADEIFTTYKGIRPWDKQGLDSLTSEMREALKKDMKAGGEGLRSELITDPIVSAISTTNALLAIIAEKEYGENFDKSFTEELGERLSKLGDRAKDIIKKPFDDAAYAVGIKGPSLPTRMFDSILRFFDKIFGMEPKAKPYEESATGVKKATGGRVFGPGGPKEDKVPAWLSPGEYVIRAHSAQKLGPDVLDYINNEGRLPSSGYADGGIVKQWLKTAYEYWFGGNKKGDEELLRNLGENKRMRFDGHAGSYFESAADKKKRLDEALGYAVGGYAGLREGETYEQLEQKRRKEREVSYSRKYEEAYGSGDTGIRIAGTDRHTLDKSPEYIKQINSPEYQAQMAKFKAQEEEKKRVAEQQRVIETTQQVVSSTSTEPPPVTRGSDGFDYMNGKKVRYFTAYGNDIQEQNNSEEYAVASEVLGQRTGVHKTLSEEYYNNMPKYKGQRATDKEAVFYSGTDPETISRAIMGSYGTGVELSQKNYYDSLAPRYEGTRGSGRFFTNIIPKAVNVVESDTKKPEDLLNLDYVSDISQDSSTGALSSTLTPDLSIGTLSSIPNRTLRNTNEEENGKAFVRLISSFKEDLDLFGNDFPINERAAQANQIFHETAIKTRKERIDEFNNKLRLESLFNDYYRPMLGDKYKDMSFSDYRKKVANNFYDAGNSIKGFFKTIHTIFKRDAVEDVAEEKKPPPGIYPEPTATGHTEEKRLEPGIYQDYAPGTRLHNIVNYLRPSSYPESPFSEGYASKSLGSIKKGVSFLRGKDDFGKPTKGLFRPRYFKKRFKEGVTFAKEIADYIRPGLVEDIESPFSERYLEKRSETIQNWPKDWNKFATETVPQSVMIDIPDHLKEYQEYAKKANEKLNSYALKATAKNLEVGLPPVLAAEEYIFGAEDYEKRARQKSYIKLLGKQQRRSEGGPIVDLEKLKDKEQKRTQNWAITTAEEFQDQQRRIAEGFGKIPEGAKIMGLSSQYYTEEYAKSQHRKNVVADHMKSYADLTTKYNKGTNDELLKNMSGVPNTRSRFIDNPKYLEEKKAREKAEAERYNNMFVVGKGKEIDFSKLPGYLSKLKKQYDYTMKALTYENIKPEDKKLLEERRDNLVAAINKVGSGADMFSLETQKSALRGIYGGFGASSYGATARLALESKRGEEYAKAMGDKGIAPMAAFFAAPDVFSKMMKEFRSGNLTDASRKKYQDIFREAMNSGYYSYNPKDDELGLLKSRKAFDKMTGRSAFVEGIQDQITIPLAYQKILQQLAQQGDGQSAKVYHNGGIVSKTGKIFAEKGELVIPKAFADGGQVGMPSTATTALSTSIKLDASDIISKLESIELKVEDKAFKLEDSKVKLDTSDLPKLEVEKPDWTVKVEDKALKLEDNTVKLDVSDLPKLEVDVSNLPNVKIDISDLPEIKVEKPDWTVQVGVPTEPMTVKVDIGDAESRLRSAISEALSQPVRVEVDGSVNAVGGEKFDQLAQTVKSLSDRLITVKGEIDGKINMIDKGNNQTSEIDRVVSLAVSNGVSPIKQEINDLRTEVSRLGSYQRRQQTTIDARLEQMRYDLSLTQNVTGTGTGGLYGR